jgi:hypothetical protein
VCNDEETKQQQQQQQQQQRNSAQSALPHGKQQQRGAAWVNSGVHMPPSTTIQVPPELGSSRSRSDTAAAEATAAVT